jgi:conjugal transfer mating pair stabilization protein TraN
MMQCKKALGGYVDCCQKPQGVSLVTYLSLLQKTFTLTSANWDLNGILPGPLATNPLNGAWAFLRNGEATIQNAMSSSFSSAWDGLVGNPGVIEQAANAPAAGASAAGAGLTQALMRGAQNVLQQISPDLASAVFTTSTGGTVVFTAAMSTIISVVTFISWIYTIYQLVDLLIHIIWACEQTELELGAKRQLKVCHYVGSYCDETPAGICIEKQERYCCYHSPLARIMQEQIRKQGVDGGWGSGHHPRCEGLSVSELSQVNWDQVDLSEWLALLTIGGSYPTQRVLTIDGLTGSGSQFNFDNTSTPRPDTATRLQKQIDASGVDLEQQRIQSGLNLWGQGPPPAQH